MKVILNKIKQEGLTRKVVYQHFKITRQGTTKSFLKEDQERKMMEEIKVLVQNHRKDKDRRAGSRQLHDHLKIKERFNIGITKFEQLVSSYGLSLKPLRVKVVTTKSCNQSWNYKNLLNGLVLNGINQAVVGDITYVSIGKDRYYLFNLIDVYSARWVGAWIGKRMRAIDAVKAFEQWSSLRGKKNLKDCIHHTDGGGQYFSKLYLQLSEEAGLKTSVARSCLENGYAEQRNGLFKNHLLPCMQNPNERTIHGELLKTMYFYNHERTQEKLGWRSPVRYERYIQSLPLEDRPKLELKDFSKWTKTNCQLQS